MDGCSGVIPERSEIHVGVALDDPARQGVGGGSGRLGANAVGILFRGRGETGLPEIHLKISEQAVSTDRQTGRQAGSGAGRGKKEKGRES